MDSYRDSTQQGPSKKMLDLPAGKILLLFSLYSMKAFFRRIHVVKQLHIKHVKCERCNEILCLHDEQVENSVRKWEDAGDQCLFLFSDQTNIKFCRQPIKILMLPTK